MKLDLKRGLACLVLGTSFSLVVNQAMAQSGVIPSAPPSIASNNTTTEIVGKNTFFSNSSPASPSDTVIPTSPVSTPTNGPIAAAGTAPSTVNPTSILGLGGMPIGYHPQCFQQPNCRHVIDQLIHHCLGNRLFPNRGHAVCDGGTLVAGGCGGGVAFHPGFARPALPELELTAVNLVSEASPSSGPTYRVEFRNNGHLAACHFKVSLVAVLGTINELSPLAAANIASLAPGAVGNVEIQLPANVMTMGVPTQPLVPFDTLLVSVDSFNQVPETNELNNLAVMKRVGIPTAVVNSANVPRSVPVAPTSTTDTSTIPVLPPAPVAPAAPTAPVVPEVSNTVTPASPTPPAPTAPPAPEIPA